MLKGDMYPINFCDTLSYLERFRTGFGRGDGRPLLRQIHCKLAERAAYLKYPLTPHITKKLNEHLSPWFSILR